VNLLTKFLKSPTSKNYLGFQIISELRLGNYRIGIELLDKKVIRFIIVIHRKDIYKKFP
jgi:mRNA-degrading endonuclease RelE of RelBE toxin-antitoxin system